MKENEKTQKKDKKQSQDKLRRSKRLNAPIELNDATTKGESDPQDKETATQKSGDELENLLSKDKTNNAMEATFLSQGGIANQQEG